MSAPGDRSPRIIALMNQKGGVGKTTTAVNLAAAIADLGRRVLLVDLDPQSHATLHVGVDPQRLEASVYDALLDPDMDPNRAILPVAERLCILPAETDLAGAESDLAGESDRSGRLRGVLDRLGGGQEFVLIDCPPSLGVLTINALAAAGEVLIPMQAQFLALQGVGKLLETVRLVAGSVNPSLRVLGVALCQFDSQTTHAREVVTDLRAFLEQCRTLDVPWRDARVLEPPIRRNIKLAECPSFGQTIFQYEPRAPGAQDYRNLARSLVGGAPDEAPAPPHSESAAPPDEREPPEIHISVSTEPPARAGA